jgi:hypothetical protein
MRYPTKRRSSMHPRICVECGGTYIGRGPRKYCDLRCTLSAMIDRSGGPDACWPWLGRVNKDGYGTLTVHGPDGKIQTPRTHRLVLEQTLGRTLEPHELARHTCPVAGNPRCCNPAHLEVGDFMDNRLDEVRRGRRMWGAPGACNAGAKLTDADVAAILSSNEPVRALADRYGVGRASIRRIKARRLWRSLLPPVYISLSISIQASGAADRRHNGRV